MSADLVDAVAALHARVDHQVAPLEALHAPRLTCRRGCASCCTDDLTVGYAEAALLRERAADVLRGTPHPVGACAMLDAEGACRVYPHRPQVCRTQGLPLQLYGYDPVSDEVIVQRDICPLNADGPALESLDEAACWHDGAVALELQQLAEAWGKDPQQRTALRSLFG